MFKKAFALQQILKRRHEYKFQPLQIFGHLIDQRSDFLNTGLVKLKLYNIRYSLNVLKIFR